VTDDTRGRVSEEPLLVITRDDVEDALVLSFIGEADMSTAALIQTNLDAAFDAAASLIVFDLESLSFVDSMTISLWIVARQKAEESGRLVRIAAASGIVAQVIQISGLDQFFVVVDTVEQALRLPRDTEPRPA
jgi:anti-sigma B factor antagonist